MASNPEVAVKGKATVADKIWNGQISGTWNPEIRKHRIGTAGPGVPVLSDPQRSILPEPSCAG